VRPAPLGCSFAPWFLILFSCGGNSSYAPSSFSSSSSSSGPPPVQAASGFTNASLSGGYAFGVVGTSGSQAQAGSGLPVADGNGNITSGDETLNIGVLPCNPHRNVIKIRATWPPIMSGRAVVWRPPCALETSAYPDLFRR